MSRPLSDEFYKNLDKRIYLIENDIVVFSEVKVATPQKVEANFAHLRKITAHLQSFSVLLDLHIAERPNAAARAMINQELKKSCKRATHIAYHTGSNNLIRAAIRFAMYGMVGTTFTIDKTKAIENCINARHARHAKPQKFVK